MSKLSFSLTQLIWRNSSSLLSMLAVLVALGFFIRLSYQQFLFLQAQNISALSLFNELVVPLAGLTLICQLLLAMISSVQLMPRLNQLGQSFLVYQASISPLKSYLALLTPVLIFSAVPWFLFVVTSIHLNVSSELDLLRLGITIFGLLIVSLSASLLIFCCNLMVNRVLTGLLLSVIVVSVFMSVDSMSAVLWMQDYWRGLFSPFYRFREGILVYADLLVLFGWLIFLFSGGFLLLHKRLVLEKFYAQTILALGGLMILSGGLIGGQIDLTQDNRNTFDQQLLSKLNQQTSPLSITAVINDETNRDEIMRGFEIVKRFYPNTDIEFRSRQSLGPEYQHQGEYLQFQLGELFQAVAYPLEHSVKVSFEMAINQMLLRKSQWITFVEGHGEASPIATKTSDLGELHNTIKSMGWPVAAQNLKNTPVISDNTGLLVIASSKQEWLEAEVTLVLDYLDKGGNLLLLVDPDSKVPQKIEKKIGISRIPGTLVDWKSYQGGTPHPAIVVVSQLNQHPVVAQLNSLLAFPWSSALEVVELKIDPQIEYQSIVVSEQGVWTEYAIQEQQLTHNPEQGELQGEFDIAIARLNKNNQQKIIVVGDSHFASDSAINNYANKQFALNIISWLTNLPIDEQQVSSAGDSSIKPSRLGHLMFSWGYSLVLPLTLLGIWLWSRRRRKNG